MSGWTAKRFWTETGVTEVEGGFGILLDARPVRTPAKTHLVVPRRAMAEAIAAEWAAQEGVIDPLSMPITRSANAALDKVATQHAEVAAYVADYGGTDLLCYRAAAPAELAQRQAQGWDPLLDWARDHLGAPLVVTTGVLPVDQPEASVQALQARVAALDAFELAALHDLVGISGSLILGLAVAEGHLEADAAWALSRIDEDWQAQEWGDDEEAREAAETKRAGLLSAARFWALHHG